MAASSSSVDNKDISYFLAYLLLWITGLIIYLTKASSDKKAKFHAIQAIVLGFISALISIISTFIFGLASSVWVVNFLIWIYGLYIGYRAYSGNTANIPYISVYAERHSNYNIPSKPTKPSGVHKAKASSASETEALKHLKLRYAQGKITKKKYQEMKKELEG